MTVALIDDDEAVLRSLQLLLKNRGMEVQCFASAENFLKGLEVEPTAVSSAMCACRGLPALTFNRN